MLERRDFMWQKAWQLLKRLAGEDEWKDERGRKS